MAYQRTCKTCGIEFEANRADAQWCTPKCVAKYYRDHDNPEYSHAQKEHDHFHICEECQQGYMVNDYAQRGGKREPKFCSVKCKQKAYRGRVKQQAARRNAGTGTADNGKQNDKRSNAGGGKKQQEQNQRHYSRADKRDPYQILGVARTATKQQIRTAWKALILKWHPDKNPDNMAEATARSQDINWAYDRIGR